MTRSERRQHLGVLSAWWQEEVGELPANFEVWLGQYLKRMPAESVRRALELAADDEALQDSEDVLEAAIGHLVQWRHEGSEVVGGRAA
jgi:hypothetical protein